MLHREAMRRAFKLYKIAVVTTALPAWTYNELEMLRDVRRTDPLPLQVADTAYYALLLTLGLVVAPLFVYQYKTLHCYYRLNPAK